MKIKKISIIMMTIILISGIFSTYSRVYASSNWAYAAGLKYDVPDNIFDMDSTGVCNKAVNAYKNAGFNAGSAINPDKATLSANLHATVQCFFGHGAVDSILIGPTTGIYNGRSMTANVTTDGGKKVFENVQFIGTNNINWGNSDTELVSYFGCNTAGEDGNVASDSLARTTCYKGAYSVLGYTTEFHNVSSANWANRYNEKLGQGYGIDDAVNYANSFNYMFNDVKNVTVWSHGINMKIGKYNSSNNINILDEDSSVSDRLVYHFNKENIMKVSSESDIESSLSKIYDNFDINNYVVEKSKASFYDINTNLPIEENVYYDYKLKIGDYITDAGYTVKVKNGVISEIYDNNIDLEDQKILIQNTYDFNNKTSDEQLLTYKSNLNKNIATKYDNKAKIVGDESMLYYDIKNNKKYIIVSCESVVDLDGIAGAKSIDSMMYEIR